MISSCARDSIEHIFLKAARSRLPLQTHDACDITPLTPADVNTEDAADNLVILTISSVVFRLLLVFNFDEDTPTRDYFLKDAGQGSLQETLLEICNLCCGAMNHELLHYFPDLGMSTPYVLSARCLPHLEELKPDYLASYAITISESVRLAATVCVCADAPIDFTADVSNAEESTGELELF
jgi:hypothetical protein